jgi:hypothetical protein
MTLTALKTTARDLVRRHLDRSSRPLRIARGRNEYRRRRDLARQLTAADGYDITELSSTGFMQLVPAPALVGEVVAEALARLQAATALPQRGNKPFFSQLLRDGDYHLASPFMRLALAEPLLNSVARYLGCLPFLQSVELLYSKPLPNQPMASQLWHRDRRDLAIIKVFVYATDVALENGPLTMLSRDESRRVPEYLPHYLTDEQLARHARIDRAVSLTGPAGTTWMVDSENCYHLGSRCKQPRLAYVAYFDSGFGFRDRERSWRDVVGGGDLSELQQFALGMV